MLQYTVAVVFVELLHYTRFGKGEAGIAINGSHDTCGVFLPDAWSGADLVKHHFMRQPVLPQATSLLFSDGGKFVVILIEKGCLSMPNQEEATHASPNGFSICVEGIHCHAAVRSRLWWNSAKVL